MGLKAIKDRVSPCIPGAMLSAFHGIRSCSKPVLAEMLSGHLMASFKKRLKSFEKRIDVKSAIDGILNDDGANYKTDLHPKDRNMSMIRLRTVRGLGAENTAFLINELVRILPAEEPI